jgi:hypothetical protein
MQAGRPHGAPVDINVPVDIDITVDIYIHIMAAPTPGAPAPTPDRSYRYSSPEPEHTDSDGNSGPTAGRINQRRIRRIPPWPIDNYRVISRHINDFGICRLDLYGLSLDNHLLLLGRLEIARGLGLLPQFLNGIHDIGLLGQESLTQPLCPRRLLGHHVENLWKGRQRLHAQVPGHLVQSVIERVSLKVRVCLHPSVRFRNLIRVRRRYEDLREQRIGIERDRGEHLVQLLRAECRGRAGILSEGPEGDQHHNEDPDESAGQKQFSLHNLPPNECKLCESCFLSQAKSALIPQLPEITGEAPN